MSKCTAPELNGNNQSKETTQLKEINKLLIKYQEQSVTDSESQKEQIREKEIALTEEKNAIELAQAESAIKKEEPLPRRLFHDSTINYI
ncbi:MAG: hypothetical protein K2L34_02530 [Muribaculaceae bacterium]|nr:hypothetical protein [Muribaculaceae bacterium]